MEALRSYASGRPGRLRGCGCGGVAARGAFTILVKLFRFAVLSGCLLAAVNAQIFHVATNGRDDGAGRESAPFATIARARDAVRAQKLKSATVLIHGGVYRLTEPLTFTAEDSGTTY